MNHLVTDATRFAQTFASVIEEHPLLIYLSGFPFTPVDTTLFRTFADTCSPWIVGGYHKSWPPLLQVLIGHKDNVYDLAFSSDGSQIASASFNKTIRIWEVSSGVSLLAPLEGHTVFIFAVAFSVDDRQVVSGSVDTTVRIWDTISGKALRVLSGHVGWVFAVVFSPDGHRVASGSADHTIRVWDIATGSDVFGPMCGQEERVNTIMFTPDGKLILSGSSNLICGWNALAGGMILVLRGHYGVVRSISISSDGNYIASGSDDGTMGHRYKARAPGCASSRRRLS